MASPQAELVKKLVDAGIHFGHPASRWNPKMQPYIHGKRGNVHIIDVKETLKGLLRARALVGRVVSDGRDVLFVGTKRQARDIVAEQAQRCGMHHVTERWLGGTLTNFRTIRARLSRLDELDKLWETGEIETYSKKMKSTLARERRKIKINLEGIRKMDKMPGLIFVIDTRREKIAVKEAKKLGVATIALIDTDSDPDLVDLPIPGNDDAMKAIELIMSELADAVIEGKKGRSPDKTGEQAREPRRRSSRASFRAEDGERRPARAAGEEGRPPESGEAEASPATGEEPAPAEAPVETLTA